MPVKSPAHITVALPEGTMPSHETNEMLIRRFLKACKKENIQENVFEKSSMVRRFTRPSEVERQRKMKAKRRAIREYKDAERKDADSKLPAKKRKSNINKTEKKDG